MSRLKTISKYAVLLVVLCGIAATGSFAGTLSSGKTTTYAHEIATSSTDLTFATQTYTMGIGRANGQSFIFRYTLNQGVFGSPTPTLAYVGAGTVSVTLRSGGQASSQMEWDVIVGGGGITAGETFNLTGAFHFPASAAISSTTTLTAYLRDNLGDLDTTGTLVRNLGVLKAAATFTATANSTGTVIDATVNPPQTLFVTTSTFGGVSTASSNGLTVWTPVTATKTVAGVKGTDGMTDYSLAATDLVTFTITGNFSGISRAWFDLDASAGSSPGTGEQFTISSDNTTATLSVAGNLLGTASTNIYVTKTPSSVLTPRVFGIAAAIAPAAGTAQNRSLDTAASTWWTWNQNGTTLTSVLGIIGTPWSTKYRFTNGSSIAVTILVSVVLDQGAATVSTSQITVPALGSNQVTLDAVAGTGEVGPILTLTSGTLPVRCKAIFTALANTANVLGVTVIANTNTGTITVTPMDQTPVHP